MKCWIVKLYKVIINYDYVLPSLQLQEWFYRVRWPGQGRCYGSILWPVVRVCSSVYRKALHCMWIHFTLCEFTSLYVKALHCMWRRFTVCEGASLYVNSLHCMWIHFTVCEGASLYVNSLHCMWRHITVCEGASLYVKALHCMWIHFTVCEGTSLYVNSLHSMWRHFTVCEGTQPWVLFATLLLEGHTGLQTDESNENIKYVLSRNSLNTKGTQWLHFPM